ncbi:hypothetical protein [Nocardioides sp. cx-173]|uniref:hypothetical protein n=1 Tax=Nocardioides sp. cx-173 TaxID=2898796 RepID=UPI001E5935C4|nr:hypothetical protein [Nocardioides sp. cx-173]MCD4525496.1 hypothetical protein [Nocardioides sp. cx-173]UGB42640.1 hypothetical protein LQ940_03735 [Nocardioides sp. cx-173]
MPWLDAVLLDHGLEPRTLDPRRAPRCEDPSRWLADTHLEEGTAGQLLSSLERIVVESARHFPNNIFWDFGYLAESLLRQAIAARDPIELIQGYELLYTRIMRIYGGSSSVGFQYLHDFLYGFDWSKWVRNDPDTRRQVGPFDRAYLSYVEGRGHELLRLIAEDDAKYPRLRDGRYRNPFAFARDPEAESLVMTTLAARGLVPVAAWERTAVPAWWRPAQRLREELVVELGLAT